MSNSHLIILVAVVLHLLFHLYQRKGGHVLTKIVHFICVFLYVLVYGGIIGETIEMLMFPERFYADQPVGMLPEKFFRYLIVPQHVLATIMLILVFRMIMWKDRARKVFVWLLPLLATMEVLFFYKGYVGGVEMNGGEVNHSLAWGLAIGFMGLSAGIYMLIYSSRGMKILYNPEIAKETVEIDDILDDDLVTDPGSSGQDTTD